MRVGKPTFACANVVTTVGKHVRKLLKSERNGFYSRSSSLKSRESTSLKFASAFDTDLSNITGLQGLAK